MPSALGFAIGESFAELSGFSTETREIFYQARWFLPKKSVGDGLRDALKSCPKPGGVIRVATESVERILKRAQGRAPAILVTSGFETFLKFRQPLVSPPFSLRGERRRLPYEDDFVFGVAERVDGRGEIRSPLQKEDLEFLASKLEMSKIQDVAILYLHADKNPAHEIETATFLRDRGFRVFLSHQTKAKTFEERWLKTVECAFTEAALLEEKAKIELAVADTGGDQGLWQIEVCTPHGPRPLNEYSAVNARGGLEAMSVRQISETETHLHCGLDGLRVFSRGTSEMTLVQPTSLIDHGLWSFPHFSDETSGFEPGPMLFGKSHELAAIDVLYVRERLLEIEGLTPLLSVKSRVRILESLFTLGKTPGASAKKTQPDPGKIAGELEAAFIEGIAMTLASKNVSGEVTVSGALAETLMPIIRERRSDLKFKLAEGAAFYDSRVCALAEGI